MSILSNNHWCMKGYKQRITRKQLQEILLSEEDKIIRGGDLCYMKKKALGVGVYEIWFETETH